MLRFASSSTYRVEDSALRRSRVSMLSSLRAFLASETGNDVEEGKSFIIIVIMWVWWSKLKPSDKWVASRGAPLIPIAHTDTRTHRVGLGQLQLRVIDCFVDWGNVHLKVVWQHAGWGWGQIFLAFSVGGGAIREPMQAAVWNCRPSYSEWGWKGVSELS